MLGIMQDPVVGTSMNQENSKGSIFSLVFFLEQLGDFLVAWDDTREGVLYSRWPFG